MLNEKPRRVARIEWPTADMAKAPPTLHSEPGHWLYLENFYHGDHDEDWVIARDDAQREIARYNPRHLSAIVFTPE